MPYGVSDDVWRRLPADDRAAIAAAASAPTPAPAPTTPPPAPALTPAAPTPAPPPPNSDPYATDALVPPGVRVPSGYLGQNVTLITAPSSTQPPPTGLQNPDQPTAATPAAPIGADPNSSQPIPAFPSATSADYFDTDALVPIGVHIPRGYLGQNVTLIPAPAAQAPEPLVAQPPSDSDVDVPARRLQNSVGLTEEPRKSKGFYTQLAKDIEKAAASVAELATRTKTPKTSRPPSGSGKQLSRPLSDLIDAAKHPPKLTSQEAARVRKLEQTAGNQIANPALVVKAAAVAHLPIAIALGVLSQESFGGRNVWGNDQTSTSIFAKGVDPQTGRTHGGQPYAYTNTVTEAGYKAYRAEQEQILTKHGVVKTQGVGPTQLTEPFLQNYADAAGGSWKPFPNLIIGFSYLAYLIGEHGLLDGLHRYNGGLGYANPVLVDARDWVLKLGVKGVQSP